MKVTRVSRTHHWTITQEVVHPGNVFDFRLRGDLGITGFKYDKIKETEKSEKQVAERTFRFPFMLPDPSDVQQS